MSTLEPFSIAVPDTKLENIRRRVAAYQWFPAPQGLPDWQLGMSTKFLKGLQAYWQTEYDWRAQERLLNRYPHFKAKIDGLSIHFLHIIGEADGKRPLLLTHGWPGSFFEFYEAIGPLAYPSQYGGEKKDAFDLVVPSLPGYAFSAKPPGPIGPRATAALFDKLMREVLGCQTYRAQGGDWGAMVTSWLGLNHSSHDKKGGCEAIHLNMIGFRPTPAQPQNDDEIKWLQRTQAAMQAEGSYFMQQATKPQTLAMALMDSPMGTAAWILEKFYGWSDLKDEDLYSVYSADQLLTNIMLYLVNDAIATSVWYYVGFMMEGGPALPEGVRCETPTSFANFPGEKVYTPPPRSWCDRAYNITHWSDIPRGGHFAAMEAPELFVDDVRAWARSHD